MLEALKVAEKPLTVREVAERILTAKRVPVDPKAVKDMVSGLSASFARHKGETVRWVGEGPPQRWALVG
jgi:hypothetical protein